MLLKMNISITNRISRSVQERFPRLVTLLDFWGVRDVSTDTHYYPNPPLCNASANQLWDWFEKAKIEHRKRILLEHPDRGGSWEKAAELNAMWDRTVDLFARQGIKPEGTKS